MPALTLDLFSTATDPEAARYRVLAGLQEARHAFGQSRVYPHLADLIALRRELGAFLDALGRHRDGARERVVGLDADTLELRTDGAASPPLLAEALAEWALPHLAEAIDEGRTLFDFVDQQAALAVVGLVPPYVDEGVLVVDDDGTARAVRYALGVLTAPDGRYRSLRTQPLDVELDPMAPPARWADALREACPELPALALYRLDSDVAFPYDETLLPIAKRKLMQTVGAA